MIRAAALVLLTTPFAVAEPMPPVSGRIERPDAPGTCGAVLLDPDLLLTAAHCVPPDLAGMTLRSGGGAEVRALGTIHPHPANGLSGSFYGRFGFDLAVARLIAPIETLAPLNIGPPATVGEILTMETWRRGEAAPGRTACPVLRLENGLLVLDCAVSNGHSGAPVLRFGSDGAELVATIVATLTLEGRSVALAIDIGRHIETLRDLSDEE